jgi:toxin ParE1/3/4
MRLAWSAHALRQLDAVGAFISRDNPRAASKLLKTIRKSATLLLRHPFLGRKTQFADVRELVVHPNYLLSYRVSAQQVEILQLWHVAQQRYH